MELKEGMYVRTKKGNIAKILGVDYLLDDNGCELNNIEAIYLDKMVDEIGKDIYAGCVSQVFKECRASDNLIDLIEVGDYVNGSPVCDIKQDENGKTWVYTDSEYRYGYLKEEIKSVVTKEMFYLVKYEVE